MAIIKNKTIYLTDYEVKKELLVMEINQLAMLQTPVQKIEFKLPTGKKPPEKNRVDFREVVKAKYNGTDKSGDSIVPFKDKVVYNKRLYYIYSKTLYIPPEGGCLLYDKDNKEGVNGILSLPKNKERFNCGARGMWQHGILDTKAGFWGDTDFYDVVVVDNEIDRNKINNIIFQPNNASYHEGDHIQPITKNGTLCLQQVFKDGTYTPLPAITINWSQEPCLDFYVFDLLEIDYINSKYVVTYGGLDKSNNLPFDTRLSILPIAGTTIKMYLSVKQHWQFYKDGILQKGLEGYCENVKNFEVANGKISYPEGAISYTSFEISKSNSMTENTLSITSNFPNKPADKKPIQGGIIFEFSKINVTMVDKGSGSGFITDHNQIRVLENVDLGLTFIIERLTNELKYTNIPWITLNIPNINTEGNEDVLDVVYDEQDKLALDPNWEPIEIIDKTCLVTLNPKKIDMRVEVKFELYVKGSWTSGAKEDTFKELMTTTKDNQVYMENYNYCKLSKDNLITVNEINNLLNLDSFFYKISFNPSVTLKRLSYFYINSIILGNCYYKVEVIQEVDKVIDVEYRYLPPVKPKLRLIGGVLLIAQFPYKYKVSARGGTTHLVLEALSTKVEIMASGNNREYKEEAEYSLLTIKPFNPNNNNSILSSIKYGIRNNNVEFNYLGGATSINIDNVGNLSFSEQTVLTIELVNSSDRVYTEDNNGNLISWDYINDNNLNKVEIILDSNKKIYINDLEKKHFDIRIRKDGELINDTSLINLEPYDNDTLTFEIQSYIEKWYYWSSDPNAPSIDAVEKFEEDIPYSVECVVINNNGYFNHTKINGGKGFTDVIYNTPKNESSNINYIEVNFKNNFPQTKEYKFKQQADYERTHHYEYRDIRARFIEDDTATIRYKEIPSKEWQFRIIMDTKLVRYWYKQSDFNLPNNLKLHELPDESRSNLEILSNTFVTEGGIEQSWITEGGNFTIPKNDLESGRTFKVSQVTGKIALPSEVEKEYTWAAKDESDKFEIYQSGKHKVWKPDEYNILVTSYQNGLETINPTVDCFANDAVLLEIFSYAISRYRWDNVPDISDNWISVKYPVSATISIPDDLGSFSSDSIITTTKIVGRVPDGMSQPEQVVFLSAINNDINNGRTITITIDQKISGSIPKEVLITQLKDREVIDDYDYVDTRARFVNDQNSTKRICTVSAKGGVCERILLESKLKTYYHMASNPSVSLDSVADSYDTIEITSFKSYDTKPSRLTLRTDNIFEYSITPDKETSLISYSIYRIEGKIPLPNKPNNITYWEAKNTDDRFKLIQEANYKHEVGTPEYYLSVTNYNNSDNIVDAYAGDSVLWKVISYVNKKYQWSNGHSAGTQNSANKAYINILPDYSGHIYGSLSNSSITGGTESTTVIYYSTIHTNRNNNRTITILFNNSGVTKTITVTLLNDRKLNIRNQFENVNVYFASNRKKEISVGAKGNESFNVIMEASEVLYYTLVSDGKEYHDNIGIVNPEITSMKYSFLNVLGENEIPYNPWSDNYSGVSLYNKKEWVIKTTESSGNWSRWSSPELYGSYDIEKYTTLEGDNHAYTTAVFCRSKYTPNTPSGGSYSNSKPSGWDYYIPDYDKYDPKSVWMSTRVFSSNGTYPQTSSWSNPINLSNNSLARFSTEENPTDIVPGTNGWTTSAGSRTKWVAIKNGSFWERYRVNGSGINDGLLKHDNGYYYLHVKFSNYSGGTLYNIPNTYVGHYKNSNAANSSDSNSYTWEDWKGNPNFGYEYYYKETSTYKLQSVSSGGWSTLLKNSSTTYPYIWKACRRYYNGSNQNLTGAAGNSNYGILKEKWHEDTNYIKYAYLLLDTKPNDPTILINTSRGIISVTQIPAVKTDETIVGTITEVNGIISGQQVKWAPNSNYLVIKLEANNVKSIQRWEHFKATAPNCSGLSPKELRILITAESYYDYRNTYTSEAKSPIFRQTVPSKVTYANKEYFIYDFIIENINGELGTYTTVIKRNTDTNYGRNTKITITPNSAFKEYTLPIIINISQNKDYLIRTEIVEYNNVTISTKSSGELVAASGGKVLTILTCDYRYKEYYASEYINDNPNNIVKGNNPEIDTIEGVAYYDVRNNQTIYRAYTKIGGTEPGVIVKSCETFPYNNDHPVYKLTKVSGLINNNRITWEKNPILISRKANNVLTSDTGKGNINVSYPSSVTPNRLTVIIYINKTEKELVHTWTSGARNYSWTNIPATITSLAGTILGNSEVNSGDNRLLVIDENLSGYSKNTDFKVLNLYKSNTYYIISNPLNYTFKIDTYPDTVDATPSDYRIQFISAINGAPYSIDLQNNIKVVPEYAVVKDMYCIDENSCKFLATLAVTSPNISTTSSRKFNIAFTQPHSNATFNIDVIQSKAESITPDPEPEPEDMVSCSGSYYLKDNKVYFDLTFTDNTGNGVTITDINVTIYSLDKFRLIHISEFYVYPGGADICSDYLGDASSWYNPNYNTGEVTYKVNGKTYGPISITRQ